MTIQEFRLISKPKFHIPLSKTNVTFITGDNGVGKSTIAQTLSGNISPNDIEIFIDHKELVFNGKPFQKNNLYPARHILIVQDDKRKHKLFFRRKEHSVYLYLVEII